MCRWLSGWYWSLSPSQASHWGGPRNENKDVYIYPEVCVAIDHHGSLNELIRTFQEVMPRDHTGIIDQDWDLANLLADPFGCQVDILPLSHITGIGKNLQVTVRQNFFLTIPSCPRKSRRAAGGKNATGGGGLQNVSHMVISRTKITQNKTTTVSFKFLTLRGLPMTELTAAFLP